MEILNLKLWWEGPEYLKEDESLWPKDIVEKQPSNVLKEVKMKNSDLSIENLNTDNNTLEIF